MSSEKAIISKRYALSLLGTCLLYTSGCIFDTSGLALTLIGEDSTIRDEAGYLDGHTSTDSPSADSPEHDMVPKVDTLQPCAAGQFKCLPDGTGRYCAAGKWKSLGKCPLGCAEGAKACRIPSNVPPDQILKGTGNLDATGKGSPITIDTDTGKIKNIRSGGPGLDSASGIHFATVSQKGTTVGLGVLSMKQLIVPQGTVIEVVGSRALVILASETASIKGVISLGSMGQTPGPGGFAGGNPGMPGQGQCGGKTGKGDDTNCGSGGGGAGHGGSGGGGGDSTCSSPHNHKGGAGGSSCGSQSLVPLVGGSGGAGGSPLVGTSNPGPSPGPGGGGGGAIQISAGLSIMIGSGGINAGGGGGGLSTSSGGAGGGAGGAILLEAPTVSLSGGVLAGNGGGGGGGDCH